MAYKTDRELWQDEKRRIDEKEAEEDIFGSDDLMPSLSDDEYLRSLADEIHNEVNSRY